MEFLISEILDDWNLHLGDILELCRGSEILGSGSGSRPSRLQLWSSGCNNSSCNDLKFRDAVVGCWGRLEESGQATQGGWKE